MSSSSLPSSLFFPSPAGCVIPLRYDKWSHAPPLGVSDARCDSQASCPSDPLVINLRFLSPPGAGPSSMGFPVSSIVVNKPLFFINFPVLGILLE